MLRGGAVQPGPTMTWPPIWRLASGPFRWSQRYKANLEKLASGDLVQVVEVVRDLAGREASCGLSAGERRMLAKARLILLQEG